jgi:protein subunit release factor A
MIRNIPRLYHFRPLTLKLISSLQPFAARSSEIYTQIDNLISSSTNNITSHLATLHKESLKVAPQVDIYDQLTACVQEIKSLEELKARCEGLRSAMAEDRITEKEVELMILENKGVEALLPATEQDEQNAIMEIKLMDLNTSNKFVNDLVEMYTHFAYSLGWDCNLVTSKQMNHDGLSLAILNIEGMNVYKSLKYEMGIHR